MAGTRAAKRHFKGTGAIHNGPHRVPFPTPGVGAICVGGGAKQSFSDEFGPDGGGANSNQIRKSKFANDVSCLPRGPDARRGGIFR